MTAYLETIDLKKHFHENNSLLRRLRPDQEREIVRAVDGVNLSVQKGETLGLVGESGCGKSTLARLILGLLDPTSGEIRYRGDDISKYNRDERLDFRSRVQIIFQDPFKSLNPRYTVKKTLTEPMAIHDIGDSHADRVQRASELLERVRLGEKHLERYPHELSGGQRQRIAIARALSVDPEFIIADEPTSALDVSVQVEILELLKEIRERLELSMLFITHDLSVVRHITDRVAVMYLGHLVEVGDTTAIFSEPHHPYTQALLSSIPVPDPTVAPERIPLTGSVPTPIDVPTGCRFHPRCAKAIPPTEWEWSQPLWRLLFDIKLLLADGEIDPNAVRSRVSTDAEDAPDATVTDELYRTYVATNDREFPEGSIPKPIEEIVREALLTLTRGDRTTAIQILTENGVHSVCSAESPNLSEAGSADHRTQVRCHLYSSDRQDRPLLKDLSERHREKIL